MGEGKAQAERYPRLLGHNPRSGSPIVQIDPRTVMVGTIECHLTPRDQIPERGTGRWIGRNGRKGIRGMRYEFMLNEMPEECQRMDFSGEMEPYLEDVERRWNARVGELMEQFCPRYEEIPDFATRLQETNHWHAVAREMATREIVEAR